jgi:glutathione S-transferase
MHFVPCEEARRRPGLRLVVVGGVPSPWSESAKGILYMKRIAYVAVRMNPGDPAVAEWTGEVSAPVAMFDDEKPRSGWAEILLLAERLAPEPRLVPEDPERRAWLLGLSHEICGELGLGWCRRLVGIHASFDSDGAVGFAKPIAEYLAPKYGYRPDNGAEARRRVIELLGLLAGRLHAQRDAGSGYYLGAEPSALDIYSAAFMALFKPLDDALCPLPELLRAAFESLDPATEKALDPILLEHRDRIYREHLELPLSL